MRFPRNPLERLIRERGMTTQAAADAIGVPCDRLRRIASRRHGCRPDEERALADLLGVGVDELRVRPVQRRPTNPAILARNAEMHRLYYGGMTQHAIAKHFGISQAVVNKGIVAHNGGLDSRQKEPDPRWEEAYRLYTEGWLLREIGDRYGVTRECARLWICRYCQVNHLPHPERGGIDAERAYNLRAQGQRWDQVAAEMECSVQVARQTVQQYTDMNGLHVIERATPKNANLDRDREAYERRLSGQTWVVIGQSLGFKTNPAPAALNRARAHAKRNNLKFPPEIV